MYQGYLDDALRTTAMELVNKTRGGVGRGEDSARLMRFLREATFDSNDDNARLKFTV